MSCNHSFYRYPADAPLASRLAQFKPVNGGYFFSRVSLSWLRSQVGSLGAKYIQEIPCGQCIECRLRRSSEWAVRCVLEARQYKYNYFVTLTYNDLFLPKGQFISYEDGEVKSTTLRRYDVVSFIKRLREIFRKRYNHTGLRVFYCGEYGPTNGRPHYHLILFNCPELPLTWFKKEGSFDIYRSSDIEQAWSYCFSKKERLFSEMGYATVQDVTFDSCAYTARYILKKVNGERKRHIDHLDLPEDIEVQENVFNGMSNRPGIAHKYAAEHLSEIYETDSINFAELYRIFKARPPRYFDKIFDQEGPIGDLSLESVKVARRDSGFAKARVKESRVSEGEFERKAREEEIATLKEKRRKFKL